MRTVFVEVPGEIADAALADVTAVLNERLAGLTLRRFARRCRRGCATRAPIRGASELLNIFLQEGEQLFDAALPMAEANVMLGQRRRCWRSSRSSPAPTVFAGCSRSPRRRKHLGDAIRKRSARAGHLDHHRRRARRSAAREFTVVTAEYHVGCAGRGDRRDRSDAHALRQGHLAREPHLPAAERPARLIHRHRWQIFTKSSASRARRPTTRSRRHIASSR